MSIHICVHCYAAELPQFAVFLHHQLKSLVDHPPTVPYLIEVCHSPEDRATTEVLDWHSSDLNLNLGRTPILPPENLFRRAIGRNQAALRSHTELVWFTDCDYLFGEGCLDGLWKSWNELEGFASMVFPEQFVTMLNHQIGDDLVREDAEGEADDSDDLTLRPDLFKVQRSRKAIGGLQIVPGSLARKHGYLDGHRKYQKPLSKPFANFHDDVAFRKECLKYGPIIPVDVPNLFRLRHTEVTYRGKVPA
jgi:hypothetical protein